MILMHSTTRTAALANPITAGSTCSLTNPCLAVQYTYQWSCVQVQTQQQTQQAIGGSRSQQQPSSSSSSSSSTVSIATPPVPCFDLFTHTPLVFPPTTSPQPGSSQQTQSASSPAAKQPLVV